MSGRDGAMGRPPHQKMWRKITNSVPDSKIATGSVSTQAARRLRTVAHCSPDPFAAIVPAIPEASTWVVETGSPKLSAAKIVASLRGVEAARPRRAVHQPIYHDDEASRGRRGSAVRRLGVADAAPRVRDETPKDRQRTM